MINQSLSEPEAMPEPITKEESVEPATEIATAGTEVEKIGDRLVKVQFIEYTGKRKKVTHIEVKEAELDEMLKQNDKPGGAQFEMF